jgi:hypothetical protein
MSWKPRLFSFVVAAWLGCVIGPAMAGPEQAPKPKTKTPQERVAEIDGELILIRKQIEGIDRGLRARGCGWGPKDAIADARRHVEDLRRRNAPEDEIQAVIAKIEEAEQFDKQLRAQGIELFNAEKAVVERAQLSKRLAELETERVSLLKLSSGSKATVPAVK